MKLEPVHSNEEVIFYDTDTGGVVSNIAYLRFVEKARCQLFASLGMELSSMNDTGLFPTVIRTEIDYLRPARLGDQLSIEAAIQSMGKLRIHCRFLILSAADKPSSNEPVVYAEALQTIVLVQMPEGKPVRVPETWTV